MHQVSLESKLNRLEAFCSNCRFYAGNGLFIFLKKYLLSPRFFLVIATKICGGFEFHVSARFISILFEIQNGFEQISVGFKQIQKRFYH